MIGAVILCAKQIHHPENWKWGDVSKYGEANLGAYFVMLLLLIGGVYPTPTSFLTDFSSC